MPQKRKIILRFFNVIIIHSLQKSAKKSTSLEVQSSLDGLNSRQSDFAFGSDWSKNLSALKTSNGVHPVSIFKNLRKLAKNLKIKRWKIKNFSLRA
ncbi:MAG: hypothetical protein A3A10_01880 [Candidatus Tagabacteria bacterium RIFCSPLOWO2_01_FULL_42_9]|uniref:Uncharacterized protein n=1 Tax=Candidatus Tagabacteria bacterium RIFCSPLOWO2_01_FULL_42_9 TaxID=1802296 RepID=A0A1G2LUQ4_9BACT|nr:MAG: hypothetical protein A3A10_01880 [Candidatus Tagabacteria bacterium RIFCSPLOWO2_01_FULL_42_9]